MNNLLTVVHDILYAAGCAAALFFVLAAPAWFAVKNKAPIDNAKWIRLFAYGFGWTGIGWLAALIISFIPSREGGDDD